MRIHELRERDLKSAALSHWLKSSDLLRLSPQFPGVSVFSESILEQIWLGIEKHGDRGAKERVRQCGVESLHRFLKPNQIHALSVEVNAWANQHIYPLLNRLIEDSLQIKQRFYLSTLSVVRFYVPWENYVKDEPIYGDSHFFELRSHNPHLDSWFGFPDDTINLWVSLGRTQKTNGVLFYPSAPRLALPSNPDEPPRDWALGEPTVVSGSAHEVLLFAGDIPHGTSVNRSDETRVSATFRFFLERPDKRTRFFFLYRHGGKRYEGRYSKRWSELVVGFRKKKFLVSSRVSLSARRLKRRVSGVWINRVPEKSSILPPAHAPLKLEATAVRASPELGAIEAISSTQCRVWTKTGWVTFQRHCPHRGADLSHGTFHDDQIRCAWHNVGFSVQDGKSECVGIPALRVLSD